MSVSARSWRSELRAIKVVWRRELIRFSKDRLRIVTSLIQPLLFLFVLGSGLQQLSAASTHGVDLKTEHVPLVVELRRRSQSDDHTVTVSRTSSVAGLGGE